MYRKWVFLNCKKLEIVSAKLIIIENGKPMILVLGWLKSHFTSNRVAMVQLILSNCRNIPTICFIDEPPTSFKVNVCSHISKNLVQSNLTQLFQIVGIFLHF